MPNLTPYLPDRRSLMVGLGLYVVVAAVAYGCVLFSASLGRVTPIWLANAVTLAALLRTPVRRWPTLVSFGFAGTVTANLLAGHPLFVDCALALCDTLECLACAWFLRRRCGATFNVGRPQHLVWFVVASVGACLLSAAAAAIVLQLLRIGDPVEGLVVWAQANTLGLLTVTPTLLVVTRRTRTPVAWREGWTLAVLAAVTVWAFFLAKYPVLFVVSAALVLPTWRMGLAGAVAGFAIIAALSIVATFGGHNPISVGDTTVKVVGLQVFMILCFLASAPLAAARDESERLKLRLRRALDRARTAHHEAARAAMVKTDFLANMSHELRTPLTSVVGFTRLAAEQPDLSPLSRDYIDRVEMASRALLSTVNDILDFSKLEAGQVNLRPAAVKVRDLAGDTLNLFAPQAAAKDVALVLADETAPDLVLSVDPDRLRQVILNLVGNAVKFTAHGQVVLSVRYDEVLGQLNLSVADSGQGIPANRLDLLFKRFSQVDGSLTRDHGGTGLGLAICKGIVEAMGGRIGVTSTPEKGSCFSFSVPAARAVGAVGALAAAAPQTLMSAGVRVLVTDDHSSNRELVRLFLAAIAAEITEAVDGQMAVELAAQRPFDVILMDLRMPRMDGAEALQLIRASAGPNRDTPVLAFTADAGGVLDGRLRAVGFDGAVAKPLEPVTLIGAISSVLNTEAAPARAVGAA